MTKMKELKTVTKNTTIKTYEVYKTGEHPITLEVTRVNGKISQQVLQTHLGGDAAYAAYVLNMPAFKEHIKTRQWHDFDRKMLVSNLYKEFSTIGFDPERLVVLESSGEMFFDIRGRVFPHGLYYSYIGSGIRQGSDYNYEELVEYLRTHPQVTDFEEKEIPGYNSEFPGQRGLKTMCVSLTEEQANEVWDKVKHTKYPSVRYKEAVTQVHVMRQFGVDPLGLLQFAEN